jgi:hypothetical protein
LQYEKQKSDIKISIRKKNYDDLPDEVKRLFTTVKYGKDKVSWQNSYHTDQPIYLNINTTSIYSSHGLMPLFMFLNGQNRRQEVKELLSFKPSLIKVSSSR